MKISSFITPLRINFSAAREKYLTKIRRSLPSFPVAFGTILLLALVFLGLWFLYRSLFPNNDYAKFLRQGVLLFWQGQNPYLGAGPFNPPWLYIFLTPLLIFPAPVGAALLTLLDLVALAWLMHRNRASLFVAVLVLLSPVVLSLVMTSNVDALLLLGVFLPPEWGLFVVLAKPQLGLGVALYWAWEAYRAGGIRRLVRVFAPVGVAFLLSFAVYGNYLLRASFLIDRGWNVNRYLFPYMILPALLLLFAALRRRRISLTYAVGPFTSPYATPNSYVGLLPAFAWDWRWALLVWVLEWGVFLRQVIQ